MRSKTVCAPVAGLVGLAMVGLSAGCGYESVVGRTMGTTYAIEARCPVAVPVATIAQVLARVDSQMSTYRPDSELMAFNRAPVGPWIDASPDLVDVVATAKAVAEQTGGAFDPTIGPLVAVWGFGASAVAGPPLEGAIQSAKALVDFRNLRHRRAPPALAKRRALTLDLSAIAKGHAVDRIADALDAAQCVAYLIELGGEVRTAGPSPSGAPWRVGVDSPSGDGLIGGGIALRAGAVATSGDYRQYRERDGMRLSHIVDPRTGYPVRHHLASVTVVTDTTRLADAYATALMVLGEREGLAFANRTGLAARFVIRRGEGFETVQSVAMSRHGSP